MLSAATYGEIYISGAPELAIIGLGRPDESQLNLETRSGIGDVYAIESSTDLQNWTTTMLMTNTLGYGSVSAPCAGSEAFFRMKLAPASAGLAPGR